MFHLNNFQIYAYSEISFTIDRNCWHFIVSQITKTKQFGHSDSIYPSSYTGPISSDSSSTETSFTSSLCGELSCLLPVGTLLTCLAPVLAEVRNKTDPIYVKQDKNGFSRWLDEINLA